MSETQVADAQEQARLKASNDARANAQAGAAPKPKPRDLPQKEPIGVRKKPEKQVFEGLDDLAVVVESQGEVITKLTEANAELEERLNALEEVATDEGETDTE